MEPRCPQCLNGQHYLCAGLTMCKCLVCRPREATEERAVEQFGTLIAGLYDTKCGTCGEVVNGTGEDLACSSCGIDFHFIKANPNERFLEEDWRMLREIAHATGLTVIT